MDLSIIIPAYNCIDTISITIDSIAIQELNINYEVIIVNDCSDYDYSSIVDKYKDKFNIREIKTPKNIGPGGSRQFGIDNSDSKFIIFIDGDDYFYDNRSVFKLYSKIKKTDSDLVIGNFLYERDNIVTIKEKNLVWLHGKIYRREFLNKNNIRFNNSRANEDNGFNRLIILLKPSIQYLDEVVYVYKENPNSITRKNNRLYKFAGLEGLCFNINWALDEAKKRNISLLEIGITALDLLAALYYYYLDLQYEYDVDKIIQWSKETYLKYKKVKNMIGEDTIKRLLIEKKELLSDSISIKNYNITFSDFLNMIEERE